MKKFLVLAAVLLAFVMIFAACGGKETPKGTEEQTTAVNDPATEAPTEEPDVPTEEPDVPTEEPDVPTEEPTQEPDVPTEEPTQEPEVPTEEPTQEPETLPYVEPSAAGMVGKAVDAFAVNNTPYTFGETRTVTFKTGEPVYPIALLGWIGFGQAIDSYGYFINDGDFVYDAAFLTEVPADDPVRAAGNGGDLATRFGITVPTSAFSVGENKVGFVVKLADGTVVLIDAFVTVNVEKTEWIGSGIVTHQSFDQLYFGTGTADEATGGGLDIFTPGQSASWDLIVNCDFSATELTYWGWIGATGEAIGQFGYQVNGGEAIYNDEWTWATEQPVIDAAAGTGATVASRMKITISLAGIGGEGNVITVLYKNDQGEAVVLGEFVVNRKNADLNVPQDQWVITGHMPQIVTPDHASHGGMIAAGGVESAALLHQGSIYLGNLDLSKYSKVVIYWGSDASQVTIDAYNANANNRFALVSADKNGVMSPDEATIIAAATYELHGWAVAAFEIDLTNVDYSGDVYLTHDSLPGGFALVYSVEFIGGEYFEPIDPMKPVNVFDAEDISTISRPNGIASADLMDGYLHVVPANGDPNWFPFAQVNGGRYVAIRYRSSDATGANMQFFMASTGGAPSDDSSMLQQAIIVDGEWHTLIIDTKPLIDAGIYDGKFVSYFRFDPLEAGYVLDENGEPYKENDIWVKQPLPEGCSIDIAYIGFFHCVEAVEKYDADKFGGSVEPEAPANVVIDISTIEGYRAENNYGYDCPILNIGYDNVYLVGEFDLNQYSQIIIEYSYDGDTVVEGKPVEQNWAECGRTPIIGFTALNKSFGFANVTNQDAIDAGIYTDLVYTSGTWAAATRTATIEIPENIGYNGPCYISAYNPWFREIAIASITLVPRVVDEPDEPETPVVPEPVEPLEVNLNNVGISGSWAAPMDGAGLGLAAGTPVVALHYGSINLGEMDLSQYSKVTVTYSTPAGVLNGSDFAAEYEATGKRILLLNAPSGVQDGTAFELLPADSAIITTAHYDMAPTMGQIMTVEVDLTTIDYNGPLYLTFDARNANNEFGAIAYLVYVIGITFA